MDDYHLYTTIERLAPEVIAEKRKIYKGVSANVDFTADLCTACLVFRWNYSHQFLQWQELWLERPSYGRAGECG